MEKTAYLSQLLQDLIVNPGFFEVNPRGVNHIRDDLLVYVPDLCVRHLEDCAVCMLLVLRCDAVRWLWRYVGR